MNKKYAQATALLVAGLVLAAFAPIEPSAPSAAPAMAGETIIHKTNLHWPMRGLITTEPCQVLHCQDV